MAYEKLTDIKTNALQGGAITVREKPLLKFGQFSDAKNVRGRHPGFIKRKGQRKLHSTSDGSNEVLNIYQFTKSRIDESHFYAQMSDGDVLEATNAAPTVTVGAFGSEVFDGSADQIPASFGNIGDKLIFSNGVDQHQIYGGDGSVINKCIVYKGTATIPNIPVEGVDYTVEVTDYRSTTAAKLNNLSTLADYDCVFIETPIQSTGLTFTMISGSENSSAADAQIEYWDGSWTAVSNFSDGTKTGSISFAKTGKMSWDAPTDIIPKYAFGANGWWYRVSLASGTCDADTQIQSITYDSEWHSIINMWDGTPQDAVEVRKYDASDDAYYLYGSTAVDVTEMTASDVLYIACTDPIIGFYIDPGAVPSTVAGVSINDIQQWEGHAWTSVSGIIDDTSGITQPGWVLFDKATTDPQPRQFQGSIYYAYWYKMTIAGGTLSEDTNIGIQFMPYFDINEIGMGQCNAVWKDRGVYSADRWGEYIYLTTTGAPEILNGPDYGILEVGDGRSNKVVAMEKFHNELMVWQEEKGLEGGCVTLIEGYDPATFGKLILSTKIGTMNAKSVAIVDGVMTATATDERLKTIAFFLSRYGVCACDGRTINIISDAIQNYFNTNEDECIRRGYEDKMWLNYDSSENIIRVGLVSGANATTCNVFPIFDLVDKVWYFDTPYQELSCISEVEAASGGSTIVQLGGGIDDGTIYQLNYGQNDVNHAIESYLQMELGGIGEIITLREMLVRWKAEQEGDLYIEIFVNGISRYRWNVSMHPRRFGEIVSRWRKSLAVDSQHISIKIGNFQASTDMYIEDLGLNILKWVGV